MPKYDYAKYNIKSTYDNSKLYFSKLEHTKHIRIYLKFKLYKHVFIN